jgi:flagellar motor component MotA
MAYQTAIVIVLALGSFAVGLIAGNEPALGVTQPWLTLVVIPTILTGFTLAANQLKTIGSTAPNTTTETKTTVTTPPAP